MQNLRIERDTEILIDNQLKNLGWDNNPLSKDRNVYLQRVKTEEQKKKLQGKRPDYTLYPSNSNNPIAIIEAKKSGKNIHEAIKQGLDYAERLGCPIVFATDGIFTKTIHTKIKKPLKLNGEEIDELIRETLALKYLKTNDVNTLDKKVIKSRSELISVFGKVNDLLREEGLQQGLDRFNEFSNILFLKVLSEIEDIKEENGQKSEINMAYRWDFFRNKTGQELLSYISDIVLKFFSKRYQDDNIFQSLQIEHADNLKEIIDLLDGLQLTDINADIKGDAFEYFIRSYSASNPSDLGEIFTPRHIVKTTVKLLNPQIGETIYDPFCGTGGMLIVAFKYLMDTMPRNENNIETLKKNTVYGSDLTKTASIAKMNMILAGDGHSNIERKDSLKEPVDNKYDIVLTNMPFAQKTRYGDKYKIPNRNGDIVCPQHCFRAAKEGGRMAIIVPEGFLANTNHKAYQDVRKYLIDNANLKSVISLPRGAFEPYNGVKADILYFTDIKKSKTKKYYWFFDVKNDGYTLDKKRKKIDGDNDLELVLSENSLDNEKEDYLLSVGITKIDLEEVRINKYVLSGAKYIKHTIQQDDKFISLFELQKEGILQAQKGKSITQEKTINGDIPVIAGGQSSPYSHNQSNHEGGIMTISASGAYSGFVWYHNYAIWASDCTVLKSNNEDILLTKYLYYVLKSKQEDIYKLQDGAGQPHIYWRDLGKFILPLIGINKQHKIVEELESYDSTIVNASNIVNNYSFFLQEEGESKDFSEIANLVRGPFGGSLKKSIFVETGYKIYEQSNAIQNNINIGSYYITEQKYQEMKRFAIKENDLIISCSGTIGKVAIIPKTFKKGIINQALLKVTPNVDVILPKYLAYYVKSVLKFETKGTGIENIVSISELKSLSIKIPSIKRQKQIIQQIDEELSMIQNNKKLVTLFENKKQNCLNSLWNSKEQNQENSELPNSFEQLLEKSVQPFEQDSEK